MLLLQPAKEPEKLYYTDCVAHLFSNMAKVIAF